MTSNNKKMCFEGNRPLMHYVTHKYWKRGDLKYHKFEPPKPIELFELCYGESYEKKLPYLIFGIDLTPEKFTGYDFLDCYEGAPLIVHDRVLKIFQEMCPNDFQRFDMMIKNLDPKDHSFENHDFHIINVTHRIKAMDMEKSEFHESPNGILFPTKRVFKDEDCWDGHLLAREDLESSILFHPKLAKKFRRSKGIQFQSDSEAPC